MQRKYPLHPLIGVGALIKAGDEIVVVRREHEPAKGLWSIPGGLLELGERLSDGVKREVLEETGLDVKIDRLIDALDNIVYDEQGKILYHYVLIDYLCSSSRRTLKTATDVTDAQWIRLRDLDKLQTTKTLKRLLVKANLP
jgi:8-oxo-dGTP diphosphatase